MKVSEFVKYVIVPVLLAAFLAVLFRPLCMENGECDYLKLWWFMGIPFGIHRMSLWIIPKGYDIGGTMGILFINVLIGGAIGMETDGSGSIFGESSRFSRYLADKKSCREVL